MKEVLVVYYSQTGQLRRILEQITQTLAGESVQITWLEIRPETPFPFPWDKKSFFGVFPETFLQKTIPMAPIAPSVFEKEYDLVLLGYQVWYLTPSLPITSFLTSEAAARLLRDTPVITINGSRNMWTQAQEKLKTSLTHLQARWVGNIVLVDRHINHISVITIVHWMFGGKKTKKWGIFPKPGVSEDDIKNASRFGPVIRNALLQDSYDNLQTKLVQMGAVKVKPFLVLADQRANILFGKWAHLIAKKGPPGSPKRDKWLVFFNYYLLFAIWGIAPVVFIVFLISYIPRYRSIKNQKRYYASVSTKHI
ncbi:dialkylrecorsinol condensing enzyme DarA [Altibacter sp. HG106]|uniref:dialkylrecorsinol condensing enzyme DarA n=1 Tax=Altibacter sp. HG106 TaxID=3023937 RepID=UPI002350C569|nr:dialkylrecorsinol condensing enzyme DarA [Altibacter sp. HG106]MDC7994702.1 dialkylresorcinol condensing enzyme DarA [Altibacter sp. HG106]